MKLFQKLINLLRKFGINANKIELSANDVLNLLAGNTINLSSKNIAISSANFSVDKNGKAEFKDITIKSGDSVLSTNHSAADFVISLNSNNSKMLYLTHNILGINNGNDRIEIDCQNGPGIDVYQKGGTGSYITHSGITTPKLTQTSLKSKKKNIKKLNIDAVELVKNADVCLYNFKGEKKGVKKHLGLVIGEGYNCPDIVISEDGQGIEQYSYTSLLYKAFQQLLEKVERLEKEVASKNEKN